MLNITGLDSQIILQEKKMSRLSFLKNFSRQQMEEQFKYRQTIDMLPKTIKLRLKQFNSIVFQEMTIQLVLINASELQEDVHFVNKAKIEKQPKYVQTVQDQFAVIIL